MAQCGLHQDLIREFDLSLYSVRLRLRALFEPSSMCIIGDLLQAPDLVLAVRDPVAAHLNVRAASNDTHQPRGNG